MLAAGTTLGPYKILAPLGAGGMGEVYRAHDSRLGRDVAIKVLPQHLAATPEVRARFEREARTISQLNHPHICTLYDVGHQDGTDYLVMELLEGETLAHRLEKGALPVAEVLMLGRQIAEALDRAHRAGVVHRDLKPGNVMLTKGGAKLMDFGLARPHGMAAASAMSQSPTVSRPLTAEGTIVGTFQYMAPEQLEGKEADARSDIWALGCVLYEMATGQRAFAGESQASLIAAIMTGEPRAMTELKPVTPPALERVVRHCLAKDPDDRFQSARDLAFDLAGVATSASGVSPAPEMARRARRWPGWMRAGAMIALVAAGSLALARFWPVAKPAPVRLNISAPIVEAQVVLDPSPQLSPDGTQVAYAALDTSGTSWIWTRRLDETVSRIVVGTENGARAFWSPDGRFLAFNADGKLKKVPRAGGEAQILCAAPSLRGGAWSRAGVIVFAPSPDGPLYKVPANGGAPVPVTALEPARLETAHRFPTFLDDDRHFVFTALPPRLGRVTTLVGSVDGAKPKVLLEADGGAAYAPPGWLIYPRGNTLLARRFDQRGMRLTGRPWALPDCPYRNGAVGTPGVSASRTGALAYTPWAMPSRRLEWYGRDGRLVERVPVAPGPYDGGVASPDGRHIAVQAMVTQDISEITIIDAKRGIASRLVDVPSYNSNPYWSPDGRWVAYNSDRSGPVGFYRMDMSGSGPEETLFVSPTALKNLVSWARVHDGLLYNQIESGTAGDIWYLPLRGERKPVPLLRSRADESLCEESPDGQWLTYVTDVTGRREAHIRRFLGGDDIQVTTSGSSGCTWSGDGRELLNGAPDNRTVSSIPFASGSPPRVGAARLLFTLPEGTRYWSYHRDRDQFLVSREDSHVEPAAVTILMNWRSALEKP